MIPQPRELWSALNPAEAKDACASFAAHADEDEKEFAATLIAKEIRFRPKTVRRLDEKAFAERMQRLMRRPRMHGLYKPVLRLWLLQHHRGMLKAFVEQLGVPHDDGLVAAEEVDSPRFEAVVKGLEELESRFPLRLAAIYLSHLCLFGDPFWAPVRKAAMEGTLDLHEWLNATEKDPAAAGPSADHDDSVEDSSGADGKDPEDNEDFTTLDNLLIRTAVATVNEQEGALSMDSLRDLVEEVVDLNATRHRSLFHRGYLDALLNEPFSFSFQGENKARRIWYMCGVCFGLLRVNKVQDCIEVLKHEKELAHELATDASLPCGVKLLPHLFSGLVRGSQFTLLADWIGAQVARLEVFDGFVLMKRAHREGAAVLRAGKSPEAQTLFQLVDRFLVDLMHDSHLLARPDANTAIHELYSANLRKMAQSLQLQGDFANASAHLEKASAVPQLPDRTTAQILSDKGLIEGGFRSVAAVLPKEAPEHREVVFEALGKGRPFFEDAARRFPIEATNSHFCLGLLELLAPGAAAERAADHLTRALGGMRASEEAYEEAGLIDWTEFLLGVALLETLQPGNLPQASERIDHALRSRIFFPLWLWTRALTAAAMMPDKSPAERLAKRLLETRKVEAFRAIVESDTAVGNSELRQSLIDMLEEVSMGVRQRWDFLDRMLRAAIHEDVRQAEVILGHLEHMATENSEFAGNWIDLLQDSSRYSPAWDPSDAEDALIRIYESTGQIDLCRDLIRQQLFRYRSSGTDHLIRQAGQLVDCLAALPQPCDDLDALRESFEKLLAGDEEDMEPVRARLSDGEPVRVLYVGGNETQKQYVQRIREQLEAEWPGVNADFELPGWTSNWGQLLEQIKARLVNYDVVVINQLVRTTFGRRLRKACDRDTPWIACTGRGCDSIHRSIKDAALFTVRRQLQPGP